MATLNRMTRTPEMAYSLRLKKRDLRRWNLVQIMIAMRLGIGDDLDALFLLGEAFAAIADRRRRLARFGEMRVALQEVPVSG